MKRRLVTLTALLLCGAALAQTVASAPSKAAQPGDYATLAFHVSGEGSYSAEIAAPPGWEVVSQRRTLNLHGDTLVPVTLRVPDQAPPGRSPAITLQLSQGGQNVASSDGYVDVQARHKLSLRAPASFTAPLDQLSSFDTLIVNEGNEPDTVQLDSTSGEGWYQVSPRSVSIAPGQSAVVRVSVRQQGTVSAGYQLFLNLRARSSFPDTLASAQTAVIFGSVTVSTVRADTPPQLHLGLTAGVNAEAVLAAGQNSFGLSYYLSPTLQGNLSDYARGNAGLGTISGSLVKPLPDIPTLGIGLATDTWSAGLTASAYGAALTGKLLLNDWTLNGGAQVAFSSPLVFSVALGAGRPLGPGLLNLNGTLGLAGGFHNESLGGSYQWQVTPSLQLGVNTNLFGASSPSGYLATAFFGQNASWQAGNFSLNESYSGSLSGLHTLTVSGGTLNTRPFGVRGAATLNLIGGQLGYRVSAVALSNPVDNLSASLGAAYEGGPAFGVRPALSASAGVGYDFRVGMAGVGLSAAYSYSQFLPAPEGGSQLASVGVGVGVGNLGVSALGSYQNTVQSGGRNEQFGVLLKADYTLGLQDTLSASYTWQSLNGSLSQTVAGSWTRIWNSRLYTSLGYSKTFAAGGGPESLNLDVGLQNVLLENLGVSAGYSLVAPQGLAAGQLTQKFRLGLNLAEDWVVNTPAPVVQLFGGRIGGQVSGVLFQDLNLNGVQDQGEPGLAGVRLKIGDQEALTDASGHYSLRVPVGHFAVQYLSGLPASFDTLTPAEVTVSANSSQTRNVGFAPVTALDVQVQDAASPGTPGAAGVPYAAVVLQGPVSRTVVANSDGLARLGGLPPGSYTVTLDPAQLPPRYVATSPAAQLTVVAGQRPAPIVLSAAEPPRQQLSTFTAGSLAVLARFSAASAKAGETVTLSLLVQGDPEQVSVEAFGQTFKVEGSGQTRTAQVAVPAGTAAGDYPVLVTATKQDQKRQITVQLSVR